MLDFNEQSSGRASDGARVPLNNSNDPPGSPPARTSSSGSKRENNSKNINTCFVLVHTTVIALGFLQVGK